MNKTWERGGAVGRVKGIAVNVDKLSRNKAFTPAEAERLARIYVDLICLEQEMKGKKK